MGGRFSHVHYRAQDAAVQPSFKLLTQVWGLGEVSLLSVKLRRISFNFCLTIDQFAEWLALQHNPLFRPMLKHWFDTFKNTKTSTVVNGLEILTALAIASQDGKLVDKIGAVFDIFDFDESAMITLDELCILLKSVIRGLSKLTQGLGPRFVSLCPMSEVGTLARQCFRHCDLEEEQDLPRDLFIQWVKQTPKVVNLMRCFVHREFLTQEDAALTLQRCTRGMLGRRHAAEKRLMLQMQWDQEVNVAAQKIQDAVVTRKKKRDSMRQMKIEKFAHHGALYSFGANTRAQLGHGALETARQLTAPLLATFFKNSELRVVQAALSSLHASAVTSSGEVFTWGTGVPGSFGVLSRSDNNGNPAAGYVRKTPTRVEDLDSTHITECALGSHHSVALSESGVVYTWGSGSFGQLGHGDFSTDSHEIYKRQFDPHTGREYPLVDLPLQIDRSYFEEMRVLQIACGYYFNVALCEDGSVFTWGEGSEGQLGLGYSDRFQVGFLDEHIHGSSFVFMPSPTRVDELKECIGSIAVGGNHVFAVAKDHRNVYEWGAWHRRGGDTQESSFTPQKNDFLSTLGVYTIASGKEHALAITSRISFELFIERTTSKLHSPTSGEQASVKGFGLCALFGAPPVSLSRALTGGLFVYGGVQRQPTAPVSGRFDRTEGSVSAMLAATEYDRKESQIRAALTGCTGKIAYIDRSTWSGHWILLPLAEGSGAGYKSLVEIPCVPAAFGPEVTESGTIAKVWYSPEKLSSLRLYVRPDEVVGRIVVLEFDHDDITFESDDLELSEMINLIMISLVERVKDAQESGAAAVIVIFDFLEADAFPLEAAEDEAFEFTIPVVMIKKPLHGETVLEQITRTSKAYAAVCFREDVLSKQIMVAQKNGAKAVVVAQNRIEQHPMRLRKVIFEIGTAKATEATGVKIPVVMVPFEVGEQLKAAMRGVDPDDTTAQLGLAGSGTLYAWGYGENGRLGLGDTENEELFQTGFDGTRQASYQYVERAEVVSSLFYRKTTQIACGEEHSAAVSGDGVLYCWGSGRDGQLGDGDENDELTPYPVEALASVRVARVTCGPSQTFAVTQMPSLTTLNTER
ncbi:hypothetical protein Poli38472_003719 [Pythium oligandrum]|uniref:EF-hand domain-containing protein n=1 Tax=Pythium oligandrum TaxID=41045 RepID=A0A8K1FM60_PYTOL|nr:hypothetical protein Poli38472_003719 [Pythium oligandrum]|eukprot:TMW65954.1 hypothetical protein Poli38472_003719 [Pythium oligandrum]